MRWHSVSKRFPLEGRNLDGQDWLLGGDAPTFADITLCTAIAFSKYPTNNRPLDERSLVHRADLEAVAEVRQLQKSLCGWTERLS